MAQSEAINGLLAPAIESLGYELVGIEHLPQGRHSLLRIYIDAEAGITLEDCERVSHQVSGILEVEDPIKGQYTLEVSSPGLDRPLFKPEHYVRFAGKIVQIRLRYPLEGRRKYRGVIESADETTVVIHEEGSDVSRSIPFGDIDKGNLVAEM